MVRGVEHEARRAGMVVLLSNSADDPERELSSVTALRERRVDGVLLTRVAGSHDELMEQLKASHIPLVLLDRLEASPVVDQVGVETVGPMKSLVEHLIEVGHRRIAIVAGDLEVHTIRERFDGFQMAVRGAGLELPPEWILSGLDQQGQARTRVAEFLGGRNGVTALVSASNVLTAGTLLALRDAGLRIPEDLAVVTFDEFPYAELFAPRLTSVVQPAFKIGQEAMRLLIKRIAKPNAEPRTIRLQPTLSHGASCGCALGTPIVWGPEARALMPEHRSELVP
jgi:LacI family transcriptional regulator